jgi:DNA-binding GntR family transcriptional regulator
MRALAAMTETPLIAHKTLGDQVYVHIRQLLISGRLEPDDRLSLRQVAEKLGVSMMPVREAVSRLVADQALEVLPNRAVRVPTMRLGQFQQITMIRAHIEGFAAAQAALNSTAVQIAIVAEAEERFRREASPNNPDRSAAVEANQAFHFALYEASGMPDLVALIGGLWLKVGPVINLDLRHNDERLASGAAARLHAKALKALRDKDPLSAEAAIRDDILGTASFLVSSGRLPE